MKEKYFWTYHYISIGLPVSPDRFYNFTSVSSFVRSSVRWEFFSKFAHYFFLIFFMKLIFFINLLTEPDFWRKVICAQLWAKRSKNGILDFFLKILSFVFPENNAKWKFFLIIDFPLQTLYLGKFLSWSYCPKCSWPISLQDTLKCNISKKIEGSSWFLVYR